MATAQGIRAGKAFVELFADDSKLVRGLKQASAKLKAWGAGIREVGTKMMGIGAAMLTPLIASTKLFASMGDQLVEMSARTGVSVEQLSALGFAAKQSGVDMESMETSIRKMQKMIVQAAKGSKEASETLDQLGVTIKDLDGLSPDQQFKLLGDRISAIQDPTIRAAAALQVFGRSGTAILPMFEDGAAGIEALEKRARQLGLVISTQDATAAHTFSKAMEVLWMTIKQGAFTIGSALAPALTDLARWITRHVVLFTEWLKKNKDVVVWIAKVAVGVVAAGAALFILGTAMSELGKIIGLLAAGISAFGSILSALGSVLAWMITPIGATIVAVAALAGYIVYASGAGGKALSWLGDKFNTLKDDALAAFAGISDALAAGDIGLAAKILWLTLKMEWTRGTNWLSSIWNSTLLWFKQRLLESAAGWVLIAEYAWHGLEVAWIETTAFMAGVWTNFCAGIHQAWMWVAKSLEETWNKIKGLFDESFDPAAANKAVEQRYQDAKNQMWDQAKKQLAAREEQRKYERESSAAVHDATVQKIISETEKAKKDMQDEYNRKMQQNQEELDQARKDWKDAINKAHNERKAKEAGGPGPLEGPDDLLNKVRKGIGGLEDLVVHKTSVRGTFNPAAAWGLGTERAIDRIAKATEDTARNTKKIADTSQPDYGGSTFA